MSPSFLPYVFTLLLICYPMLYDSSVRRCSALPYDMLAANTGNVHIGYSVEYTERNIEKDIEMGGDRGEGSIRR